METYPVSSWSSAPRVGHRRLRLVAQLLTRESDERAHDIAHAYGRSRQELYAWTTTAAAALEPSRPGPALGWREEARLREEVERLRADNERLRAQIDEQEARMAGMVEVSRRRRDRLELVCFSQNVSLRGTQEIVEVAWGEEWP